MKVNYYLIASLILTLTLSIQNIQAEETADKISNTLYVQGGSYMHFSDNEDYAGDPIFASAEIQRSDNWLYGLGLFNNSFDQFSQYLYGGYKFEFKDEFKNFHAKITAGIIHGYKDEFEDKIPFNSTGYAPAIIPGLGWKKDKLGVDMILLGDAGLLFTVGYDLMEF